MNPAVGDPTGNVFRFHERQPDFARAIELTVELVVHRFRNLNDKRDGQQQASQEETRAGCGKQEMIRYSEISPDFGW